MKVIRIQGNGSKLLHQALDSIKGKVAKVGWVAEKKYPDSEMTTAAVAQIAEFGSPSRNIPARPIMRPTIRKRQNIWKRIAQAELKKVLAGQQTGEGVFETVGLQAAGDLRQRITEIIDPPLSPKTVAARKRQMANKKVTGNLTKPLVFTKNLLNSLTNTVENE